MVVGLASGQYLVKTEVTPLRSHTLLDGSPKQCHCTVSPPRLPHPLRRLTMPQSNKELATLAGGCFWCLEAVYDDLRGVEHVESGYMGGHVPNPTYQEVCNKTTGHAEVVQITFDPQVVSFRELLEVFFTIHDPTTLNRQGADVGPQYRSAIFYHSPEQKATAEQVIAEVNAAKVWDQPIVTEVTPASTFYVAEAYHQEYYQNNPEQGYCRVVIAPKVAKFRKQYLDKLKKG
jgi:peptide-methionine (S)-S-oxide reductase